MSKNINFDFVKSCIRMKALLQLSDTLSKDVNPFQPKEAEAPELYEHWQKLSDAINNVITAEAKYLASVRGTESPMP